MSTGVRQMPCIDMSLKFSPGRAARPGGKLRDGVFPSSFVGNASAGYGLAFESRAKSAWAVVNDCSRTTGNDLAAHL